MGRPKLHSREQILSEAVRLFWEKGLAQTSVSELEQATGVNKSGLYSEFSGGKDELFVASLQHYFDSVGVLELLHREPLGYQNIFEFLTVGHAQADAKGCFGVNCVREAAILPAQAKRVMITHLAKVHEALVRNLLAIKGLEQEAQIADLIMTFNAGMRLQQNLGEVPHALQRVDRFLAGLGLRREI